MDDDYCVKRKTNPRRTANFLSLVSFYYTIKLYIKGYTLGLETEDIYETAPSFRSKDLGDNLERKWEEERRRNLKPSICRILWSTFNGSFFFFGLIQFSTAMVMTIWSPRALSKLIAYFSSDQSQLSKEDAIFYACVVIGLSLLHVFVRQNLLLATAFVGIKAKTAVSSLLYRKSLKLSSESLSEVTAGKIINIITKDVQSFEWVVYCGNDIWICFVKICLICYLIYNQIGVAAIPGIVFFLIVMPLQALIGKLGYNYRLKCNKKTDERLESLRESLSAIKILKMYTWERFFENKISSARKAELKELHKIFYSNIWISLIGRLSSKLGFFIFLMTHVWMGNHANAEVIYYILSCCSDLDNDIPYLVRFFAEAYATVKRVEHVLAAEELPPKPETVSKNPAIILKRVSVQILKSTIFENATMHINGGLNIIVGCTGSGKTTFLKTILHDCHMTGEVTVNGRISYASQEPWLFPGTIKNNILFGADYNETRYKKVLEVCCLLHDLKQLPGGDEMVVADRGLNLSKGQQARVNLARAVYREADIYLLDDCLASVDGQVSDTIFRKCICEFLSNKICIFVTNNFEYTQRAGKVIEISSGLVRFVEKAKMHLQVIGDVTEDEGGRQEEVEGGKEIYHETKHSGKVPFKYYYKYLQHGGGMLMFGLVVLLFLGSQSTGSVSEKYLSKWITLEQNLTTSETNQTNHQDLVEERGQKLSLYATTALASITLTVIRSFAFYRFTRRACFSIHRAMVRNIIGSTMNFFDNTFIGNILTRFTKDCLTVDEYIPYVFMDCLIMIFTACGGVILLITVDYIFLLESLLLLIVACAIKQFCQPAGRNLERLHVMVRSPINGHLNSTLEGLTTIRAYRAQERVAKEFDVHQDLSVSACCMMMTNYFALGFFIKLTCAFFITMIISQFLIFHLNITVGDVGLVITQAFVITGIITSGIISVADCENLMISTERMLEFTELEEEDKSGKVLLEWPKSGLLTFDNVSLSYDSTKKNMLSNISFAVKPGKHLGIVGRTGAGKSSIISALFRMYKITGRITIDDVDIQEVALDWLRSNISIIPQDPYLFAGTVRDNLDPLKLYDDAEIWKVLDELKLKSVIKDLNVKIDKGSNFSAGQKQLLCLGRVILRNSKIIILDEATANVDQETDTLIRESVQKHFRDCTVIIIAHRLLSVMNCNKILILNNGRMSAFDSPDKLMQNGNSFFRSVIK